MLDNIKFGLAIPQGWRGGYFPLEEENNPICQYEFSKSIAIGADNLNFDSIYAYDYLIPHFKDDTEKNIFECFTLLSSLGSNYKKSKDRTNSCMQFYRNLSLLAKMLSTLDIISNGRVELGIGRMVRARICSVRYNFSSDRTRIIQLDAIHKYNQSNVDRETCII